METQEIKTLVRKFNNSIENNKELQAYSDFKEGLNKGLDIAKYTFDENVENLSSCLSEEKPDVRVKSLQDMFNQLLDGITLIKKPNLSEEHLDGVYTGFEKSKEIFRKFIEESFSLENT